MPTEAALIGPNAVSQLRAALLDVRAGRLVFEQAFCPDWWDSPPGRMVPEQKVARLHRTLRATLSTEMARQVMADAGRRTADYLLQARIPRLFQALLRWLPAPFAARLLLRAIASHAWTFAGSGRFSATVEGRRATIEIAANPLAAGESSDAPICAWHGAVFQRLFSRLVCEGAEVREVACRACGGRVCRFEVSLAPQIVASMSSGSTRNRSVSPIS